MDKSLFELAFDVSMASREVREVTWCGICSEFSVPDFEVNTSDVPLVVLAEIEGSVELSVDTTAALVDISGDTYSDVVDVVDVKSIVESGLLLDVPIDNPALLEVMGWQESPSCLLVHNSLVLGVVCGSKLPEVNVLDNVSVALVLSIGSTSDAVIPGDVIFDCVLSDEKVLISKPSDDSVLVELVLISEFSGDVTAPSALLVAEPSNEPLLDGEISVVTALLIETPNEVLLDGGLLVIVPPDAILSAVSTTDDSSDDVK